MSLTSMAVVKSSVRVQGEKLSYGMVGPSQTVSVDLQSILHMEWSLGTVWACAERL